MTLTCSVMAPSSSAKSACSRWLTPSPSSVDFSRKPCWRTVTTYRPGCSGNELYSPLAEVRTSRFTFVVRLRISTLAPATGAFAGSVTTPTMEPTSNWHQAGSDSNSRKTRRGRIRRSPLCFPRVLQLKGKSKCLRGHRERRMARGTTEGAGPKPGEGRNNADRVRERAPHAPARRPPTATTL